MVEFMTRVVLLTDERGATNRVVVRADDPLDWLPDGWQVQDDDPRWTPPPPPQQAEDPVVEALRLVAGLLVEVAPQTRERLAEVPFLVEPKPVDEKTVQLVLPGIGDPLDG